MASIYARDADGLRTGIVALEQAITIGEGEAAGVLPLVSHRVTGEGVQELALVR